MSAGERTVYRVAAPGRDDVWFEGEVLTPGATLPEGVRVTSVVRHAVHGDELHERREVGVLRCWGDEGPAETFEAWVAGRTATPDDPLSRCDDLARRVRLLRAAAEPLADRARVLHGELEARHRGQGEGELDRWYRRWGLDVVDGELDALAELASGAVSGLSGDGAAGAP